MFLLPTITANLRSGGSIKYAALVLATWCLYCDQQTDRHDKPLEIVDDLEGELHDAARKTSEDNLSFLKLCSVFGDLAKNDRFTTVYVKMIDALYGNADVSAQMRNVMAD